MSKSRDDSKPTQPISAPAGAVYRADLYAPSITVSRPSPSLGIRPVAVHGLSPLSADAPATLTKDSAGVVQHAPSIEPSSHDSQGKDAMIVQADSATPDTAILHLRQPAPAPTDAVVARLDHRPLYRREL